MNLPTLTMEKLLKKAGIKRISDTAKEELSKNLNAEIEKITKNAIEYSNHAKRKTIKKEDMKLVIP